MAMSGPFHTYLWRYFTAEMALHRSTFMCASNLRVRYGLNGTMSALVIVRTRLPVVLTFTEPGCCSGVRRLYAGCLSTALRRSSVATVYAYG